MASTKYPVLRQTLIIFSFLAIVGLFFALNHFILIPQQQQSYNNKIFRALQVVSADFEKTLDGQADYFAKNRNSTSYSDEMFFGHSGSLKQKIIDSFKKLNRTIVTTKYKRRFDFKTDTVSLLLLEDSIQKFDTAIAFRDVLEPTIQHLHKDLFDLVMLVNRDTVFTEKKTRQIHDRLLYKYGDLATGYILPGDSLFNSPRFGQFSSISDISIAGFVLKPFSKKCHHRLFPVLELQKP